MSREQARQIIRQRFDRARLFPHVEEAGWLMLVDLYVHHDRNISVTSACLASFAPMTTGLRHIGELERMGLIRREADGTDGRRRYLRLTNEALRLLAEFFDHASGHHTETLKALTAQTPASVSCRRVAALEGSDPAVSVVELTIPHAAPDRAKGPYDHAA